MSELPRAVEVTPYAFAVMTNTLSVAGAERPLARDPQEGSPPCLHPDEENPAGRGRGRHQNGRLHQARLVICDMRTGGCPTCPNPSSHVPGTVPGTGTFPERGTAVMKDFYTKLFPERSRSRSGTRNMERGTWPRSTFPASMPSTPLCLNFLKENKVHFGVFQIYSLKL